jgi:hypothetical protein
MYWYRLRIKWDYLLSYLLRGLGPQANYTEQTKILVIPPVLLHSSVLLVTMQ